MTEHTRTKRVQADVDWIKGMLSSLALRGFHGKIIINYEKGCVKNMVEERSHRPPK